jgi:signal transduction histidine kinase
MTHRLIARIRPHRTPWPVWNSLWVQLSLSTIAIVALQWFGFALWTKWVMMHGIVSIPPVMVNTLRQQLAVGIFIAIPLILALVYTTTRRALQPLFKLQSWTKNQQSSPLRNLPCELQDFANTYQQLSSSVAATQTWQRQFTTQVSHELRTPLSLVYGYLQSTIRRGDNLTEPQRTALQTAIEETEHTLDLLKSLLMFARSQATQTPSTTQSLPLYPLLLESIKLAQSMVSRPIHLQNINPNWSVWGDRELLLQIILHLIYQVDQEYPKGESIVITMAQTHTHTTLAIPHAVKVEGKGLHLLMVQSLMMNLGGSVQLSPTPQMDYDLSLQFPRPAH